MQKQLEHPKKERSDTIPFYYNTWFCLGLIVCLLTAGYLWDYFMSQKIVVTKVETASAQRQHSQNSSNVKFAKIQDIEVGERAIGKNPEVTDEDRQLFFPDPEPATWRKLTLEMIKPDGKRLDVTLLRPISWIAESNAKVGNTIFLDLPEMGAQGQAKILNVEPCPPIKPGKGNVITGTFHHEAANTIDLYVEGLDKPIGTTDNHPFWSVTRQEFVEAGKLLPGEELQLYNGQPAKVVQILPRPGPERVHNLEVMNEHVYRIAQEGVLVHNAYNSVILPTIPGKQVFAGKMGPIYAYAHLSEHHGLDPKKAHERLEHIKQHNQMGPADDVAIGSTGDVYDAANGDHLGNLISGW
jgi:hypothetical protein